MSKSASTIVLGLLILIAPALIVPLSKVTAGDQTIPAFEFEWDRIDLPVSNGEATRTWTWGPAPISDVVSEPGSADEAGPQPVQYFDKGAMELTSNDETADPSGPVLSSTLVSEMIQGTGVEPADIPVAGDSDSSRSVTYSTLNSLLAEPPFEAGSTLSSRVSPDGEIADDAALADYGIVADEHVEETNHRIASVFWEFLNATGTVWNGEEHEVETLFPELDITTGPPLTEAYWVEATVDGVQQDILVQCFERRCLTYTPDNPEGWQVEFNNAGRHFHDWQNDAAEPEPPADPTTPTESDLPTGTFETADGATHTMHLEVAAHDATRACGLMHRLELEADTGMLFVWEQDQQGAFWNCNTFVALTLAWIDADGVIIGFSQMEPQTPGEPQDVMSYPPPGPYWYVIEANQGWFDERGITAGDTVDLRQALDRGDTGSDTLCQQLGLDCN